MGEDQRGGLDGDGRLEHLARMDDRGVEAPDRDDLAPQDLIAGVQVEADEVLAVGCPDVPTEIEDRFGTSAHLDGVLRFGTAAYFQNSLTPAQRELAYLGASVANDCHY